MTVSSDPLKAALATVEPLDGTNGIRGLDSRDRLAFATGQMLSADDFQAEQGYHRGRLARALASLHGSGTVAGLRVAHVAPTPTVEEQLQVQPGIAIDRLGRLIELPRAACLRLNVWWTDHLSSPQSISDLNNAL